MTNKSILTGIAFGFACASTVLFAADEWPCFRGPNADGISKETKWNPAGLQGGAKIAWKANVGKGYSGFAVKDNLAYTMGNKDGKDVVVCLKVADGSVVWSRSYDCRSGGGGFPGPRGTPAISGKLIYTLSTEGDVLCLDLATGNIKWQKNVITEFKANNIQWGLSGSPLVVGNMVILNAGDCGIALNKENGLFIWANTPGTGGYATPVAFKNRGEDAVAIFGMRTIAAVGMKSGRKLWSFPWETGCNVNAADPIVAAGRMFISSGYDHGCALLDITGAEPKAAWSSKVMRNHFSSCILIKDHIYGIDGNAGNGVLKCIEMATGNEKWNKNLGFGSLTAANDKLIVLNEKGSLFISEAVTTGYKEISNAPGVLGQTCWTAPVLCGGRIFCRNEKGDVAVVDVSK